MAEFVKIIEQRERMCTTLKLNGQCSKCRLNSFNNGYDIYCVKFMTDHPQEAEAIIMEWAKENPIKTNADKFEEVFGFEPDKYYCFYAGKNCDDYCTYCRQNDFWSQEYKENK